MVLAGPRGGQLLRHGVGVGGGHPVARGGRGGVGRVLVAAGGELAGVGRGVVQVLGGGGSGGGGGRTAGGGQPRVGRDGGQHALRRQVGGRVDVLRRVPADMGIIIIIIIMIIMIEDEFNVPDSTQCF